MAALSGWSSAGLVGAAHAGWNVSIISSARGWLMAPAQPSPAQPRPLPTFIQIVKKKAGGEAHFRLPDFSLQHCSITAHCRLQLEDCLHFIIVDFTSLQQPCVGRSYFTPLCFLEAGGPILPWSWQNLSRQWVDTDWDRTSASVMWIPPGKDTAARTDQQGHGHSSGLIRDRDM